MVPFSKNSSYSSLAFIDELTPGVVALFWCIRTLFLNNRAVIGRAAGWGRGLKPAQYNHHLRHSI